MNIIKLIVKLQQEAIEAARPSVTQAKQELSTSPIQQEIINLIEIIIVYKLPQLSREEIATMLGLNDLKQTRFYQEVFEEGRAVGRQETREEAVQEAKISFVQRLARRGDTPEEIAQLTELPLDEVQKILQSLNEENSNVQSS